MSLPVHVLDAAPSEFDVLVVGSGPAGVAVAESISRTQPLLSVGIVERGPVHLTSHFYDTNPSIRARDDFFHRHKITPWTGDLASGGALLPAVGGRGIVGGAQLQRFYASDFGAWERGIWPIRPGELDPYFAKAERSLLSFSSTSGAAQTASLDLLAELNPNHPPVADTALAGTNPEMGHAHRCSVSRLSSLLASRSEEVPQRLFVIPNAYVSSLLIRGDTVERVRVHSTIGDGFETRELSARVFVLAASAIESARIALNSGLRHPAIGHYLAEHIYCRGTLAVAPDGPFAGAVNIAVPPQEPTARQSFHLEIRSLIEKGAPALRITGCAAMDPVAENAVFLPSVRDEFGTPIVSTLLNNSMEDVERTREMVKAILDLGSRFEGSWIDYPTVLPKGSSYHEIGTLRIGKDEDASACDPNGKLRGLDNLFVGDGAAFPSAGAANPILTLTAMGYRLGDRIAATL